MPIPAEQTRKSSSCYRAESPGPPGAELLAAVSVWGVDRRPDIINVTK